jgi:hypothetical protein
MRLVAALIMNAPYKAAALRRQACRMRAKPPLAAIA